MAQLIRCECGFIARGDSEAQVIEAISGHLAADHPALASTVTTDDLRSWIQTD